MGWRARCMGDQVLAYSSTSSSLSFSPPGMYSRQTWWYMSVLMPPGAAHDTVVLLLGDVLEVAEGDDAR